MSKTVELARHLEKLHINNMYKTDFYWTWDKTDDEIDAVFTVADALRDLRERNKSTKIFNSGLGISLFRDNSTRTRFSFASACNFLGLEEQVLDEKKSQIAHGETVRETANMVSFMADVIGIRDDMYIHQGHEYQKTFMDALEEGYRDGILEQRPTLVNLQCDVDHPTQCMADMLHVIHYFGGVENLKGKKVAMTWAYSPSYGKPLSVPQGVIGLFTRFGMDVTLAHPEGYEVMPEVEEIAKKNAAATGGSFKKCNDMKEAFKDADIVYPKSWAPFKAMEERTKLYQAGDKDGIDRSQNTVKVPNLVGKEWSNAQVSLNTKGLKHQLVESESDQTAAVVTYQYPHAGAAVASGTTIYLYTDTYSGSHTEVPDVSGKSADFARQMLTAAGLNCQVAGDSAGTVQSQSEAAGSSVQKGTVVTITCG